MSYFTEAHAKLDRLNQRMPNKAFRTFIKFCAWSIRFCIRNLFKTSCPTSESPEKTKQVNANVSIPTESSEKTKQVNANVSIPTESSEKTKQVNANVSIPKCNNVLQTGLVLIIAELSIPQCEAYRVLAKKDLLENVGYSVEIVPWSDITTAVNTMQFAERLIFYRVPYFPIVEQLYEEARRLGLTIYYDIDDLIFDEPLYESHLKTLNSTTIDMEETLHGANLYSKAVEQADYFIGSTKELIKAVQQKWPDKRCAILPNGILPELKSETERNASRLINQRDQINLFYGSGTATHNLDFELIEDSVICILKKHPNVHLYVLGDLVLSKKFNVCREQIHHISLISKENYYSLIRNFDIALMPLVDDIFNRAKSNIKYIEASMLKIPSIASNLPEFSHVISNGNDGFLACTKQDWIDTLDYLINNPNIRKEIGENAFNNVIQRYDWKSQATHLESILQLNKSISNDFTILETNIYYGISEFGGATIIVEGISEALANLPHLKPYVLSTHKNDPLGEGIVRRYIWNGLSVISVAKTVDQTKWEDSDIGMCASQCIAYIKPNLVHLHATQGFTYSVASLCSKNHIPYVITHHDECFACPRLFMNDVKGNPCNQDFIDISICENRCQLGANWLCNRITTFQHIAEGASFNFTPSFYFTKKFQKLFGDIPFLTNKNGIDKCIQKTKPSTSDNPIVFLYVGGREESKGYFLLKETFSPLQDLEWKIIFTVPNDIQKSQILNEWDNNHIEILPYQKHSDLLELMSKVDILLFPSKNIESFGLTVREAISSDVYVLSTLCGGPSEAIVDGINGSFIEYDSQKWKCKIQEILSGKEYYKNYRTSEYGDVINYKTQAEELLRFYKIAIKRV